MAFVNNLLYIIFFSLLGSSLAQDVQCPIEGVGNFPHPNCTLYIQCDNGVPIIRQCDNGLYWNPLVESCDFAGNVPECVGGTRPPVGTTIIVTSEAITTTEAPETTAETEGPTTVSSTEPATTPTDPIPTTEGPSNGCPAEGFKPIPHPDRCEKFLYCLDGEIIDEQECPDGLYFDPVLELCNFKELVDCRNPEDLTTTVRTTTTTRTPIPTCPSNGIVNLPYPGNCSLYILCVNGSPILSQCSSGTLFDPVTLRCQPAEEVNCDATPRTAVEVGIAQEDINKDFFYCPGGEEFTKMPVINDCHSWYECRKGRKVKSATNKCPLGLFFSFETQSCVISKPKYCF